MADSPVNFGREVCGNRADPVQAAQFLERMAHHLAVHGLGTASEIFDGDAPFAPRGGIAQAWTVAELLRAWVASAGFKPKTAAKRRVTARVPAGQKAYVGLRGFPPAAGSPLSCCFASKSPWGLRTCFSAGLKARPRQSRQRPGLANRGGE